MDKLNTHSSLYHHHNFQLIDKALAFYTNNGFHHIEVPWFVPIEFNLLTKPSFLHDEKSFYLSHNLFQEKEYELVGSAEQALIYLALNNEIHEKNKYVAFSPCFRSEPQIDKNHLYYFLKIELFSYITLDNINLNKEDLNHLAFLKSMAKKESCSLHDMAFNFFNSALPINQNNDLKSIELEDVGVNNFNCMDIELNNTEVGSYGNRIIQCDTNHHLKLTENKTILISYGTGLAEPRFSQNLKNL